MVFFSPVEKKRKVITIGQCAMTIEIDEKNIRRFIIFIFSPIIEIFCDSEYRYIA